jgi:hypothetical protein
MALEEGDATVGRADLISRARAGDGDAFRELPGKASESSRDAPHYAPGSTGSRRTGVSTRAGQPVGA